MRVVLAILFLSCAGESALQLTDGQPKPKIPVGTSPETPPTTPPSVDLAAIPAGDPYLPLLAGHRLAVNGSNAVVSDPEGELADGRSPKLWFVDLGTGAARSLTLPDGSRPGAVELTANGHAWVLLEGSGGIASVDTSIPKVTRFFPVCRAPVDLTFGGTGVWVACLSGEVVRVDGSVSTSYNVGGVPTRITASGSDVFVALSDASVVQIGASGIKPAQSPERQNLTPNHTPAVTRIGNPNSPRRIVPMLNGGVALLHQQSVEGELTSPETPVATSPYSGAPPTPSTCPTPATRDAFTIGGTGSTGMTFAKSRFLGTTLPLDAAFSPGTNTLAVADGATGRVVMFNATAAGTTTPTGCPQPDIGTSLDVKGATSVAFTETGTLVALSSSTQLSLKTFASGSATGQNIVLRARNVPIGFELFHASPKPSAPTEPNVACASCHPAGMNNGGALTVAGVTHKVMTLGGHLSGAPGVHWDNKPFQEAVVDGTWKTNMQGRALTTVEAGSLKGFVEQLRLPRAPIADAARVAQGQDAFFRAGCAGCHSPSTNYTNNSQADIGRGTHRVPSLVGLAYSAPYMADGCAKTIEERFSKPSCGGGELHGHPALLSLDDQAALVTFLKTL